MTNTICRSFFASGASERRSPHCVALPARERYDRDGAVCRPTGSGGVGGQLPFMHAPCRRGSPPKRPFPWLWAQPKTRLQRRFPSGRVARLSRNVSQPDHILANPIISHKAERRPGSGEIWLAVTKHDGVQVNSILIDQAKFGQALRQVRTSNFDLPVALGLELTDRALKIILNKPGVGADRL